MSQKQFKDEAVRQYFVNRLFRIRNHPKWSKERILEELKTVEMELRQHEIQWTQS